MKKWRRIDSTTLLDHTRLTVVEDKVELPNGIETKYLHFSEIADAAMVLACNSGGKFLVQKEYSYPPDEFLHQLPGGEINQVELPEAGAARELAEESGYAGELTALGWFYLNNRRSRQKMYVYLVTDLYEVAKQPDPEEFIQDFWFTEDEIDTMIRENEIYNYTLLAGWALYKSKRA